MALLLEQMIIHCGMGNFSWVFKVSWPLPLVLQVGRMDIPLYPGLLTMEYHFSPTLAPLIFLLISLFGYPVCHCWRSCFRIDFVCCYPFSCGRLHYPGSILFQHYWFQGFFGHLRVPSLYILCDRLLQLACSMLLGF